MMPDLYRSIPPPIPEILKQGRDIDIIACLREQPNRQCSGHRVFGVRWAARPDIEAFRPDIGLSFPSFPTSGFDVYRWYGGRLEPELLARDSFVPPSSQDWRSFKADADARTPHQGPWFPEIRKDNLGFLLPLLRLVDPQVKDPCVKKRVECVANTLGQPHEGDPDLTARFWPHGKTPLLADLLDDPATIGALVRFYAFTAMSLLLGLSLRFEFAVLLGLATDDYIGGEKGDVVYEVRAHWRSHPRLGAIQGAAKSKREPTNKCCDPGKPKHFVALEHPGFVRYQHIRHFDGWRFPDAMRPDGNDDTGDGRVLSSPDSPASFSELRWEAPEREASLLDHNAVLYEIRRFDHGPGTAVEDFAPSLPRNAEFREIECGESNAENSISIRLAIPES